MHAKKGKQLKEEIKTAPQSYRRRRRRPEEPK